MVKSARICPNDQDRRLRAHALFPSVRQLVQGFNNIAPRAEKLGDKTHPIGQIPERRRGDSFRLSH